MAIVKIKATEAKKQSKAKMTKIVKEVKPKKGIFKLFANIIGYFKGAWAELKQVRWPDRKSAWALTLAVIAFTSFFVGLIILLDYLFNLLFKVILK